MKVPKLKNMIIGMKNSLEEFNGKFEQAGKELVDVKIDQLQLFSLRSIKKHELKINAS